MLQTPFLDVFNVGGGGNEGDDSDKDSDSDSDTDAFVFRLFLMLLVNLLARVIIDLEHPHNIILAAIIQSLVLQ